MPGVKAKYKEIKYKKAKNKKGKISDTFRGDVDICIVQCIVCTFTLYLGLYSCYKSAQSLCLSLSSLLLLLLG